MSTKPLSYRGPQIGQAGAGGSQEPRPVWQPPRDVEQVEKECDSFTFDSFTVNDAWNLGNLLRERLLPFAAAGKPAVINIALANSGQVLFHAATGPGTVPDNGHWVQRKRNVVQRFGHSTWWMHLKFDGDEKAFHTKWSLSPELASQYAIHGGGVPIRVHGVEGLVAIVVVSGLKQDEDHGIIVETIRENWA